MKIHPAALSTIQLQGVLTGKEDDYGNSDHVSSTARSCRSGCAQYGPG